MPAQQVNTDDISLFSFREDLANYNRTTLSQDAFAAISVALLTLPQAMAYALLAGLPLSAGLFAAIYSSMIAAMFGSSRHLIIGPSNAIAILVQSGTAEILFTHYRGLDGLARDMAALQILTQLAMMVGIIQILAAWCKLGRLTQFVSHSVVVGYIAGTAIAMVVNQLFTFTGVEGVSPEYSIYQKTAFFFTHLKLIQWPTVIVGIGSLLILVGVKRINKKIPAPLITLIVAAVSIYFLNNYWLGSVFTEGELSQTWDKVLVVRDRGNLHNLIPYFAFPSFDMGLMNSLLPVSFAVALLSILETTSVSKSIAASTGQRLYVNQEIFGLGLGNLLSSFICAMPVSGSPSRSGLSYSLGAQTRFAAVLNATFVAIILYCFSFLILHIPLAALSALLLVTAANIVNPKQFFMCLKATNSDAFVLLTTLLSCLFFNLDVAFYIGVAMSITLYLKKSATPQLVEYEIDDQGDLHNLDLTKSNEKRLVRVIKVEGELFFGAADLFQITLKTIAEDDTSTKVIILQLKNARDIDATSCLALHQLVGYLKGSGRYLVACGMTQQVWDVLSDSGIIQQIGKENLFIFDDRNPHSHMTRALKRARYLAGLPEIDQADQEPVVQEFPVSLTSSS